MEAFAAKKSQGLPHKQIWQLTGISANTLRHYLRAYIEGGIDKLKEIDFYHQQSRLLEKNRC
ncbi:MAG: helix-turn-helix domain-containing protein [Deltaproteobacteria bacterium]|nr:helix-turn-helix domain-containing protein [Deltaproteobacteria bacterium]